jgi:hypothetical protein
MDSSLENYPENLRSWILDLWVKKYNDHKKDDSDKLSEHDNYFFCFRKNVTYLSNSGQVFE